MVPPAVAKRLEEKYAIVSDFTDDLDELSDLSGAPVPAAYHGAETEEILLQLRDIVDAARPMPLSASSMISKDEVLELLDEALERLPEELRAARWLLKEREEYLAKVQPRGRRDPRPGPHPRRAHGAAHRGREGGRGPRPPDHRRRRGRGPPPAPRGRGLLRPEAGQLRDRARAHHEDGRRPAARSCRAPTCWARPAPTRRTRSTCRRRPTRPTSSPTTATTTSSSTRTTRRDRGRRRDRAGQLRLGRCRWACPSCCRHPGTRRPFVLDAVLAGLALSTAAVVPGHAGRTSTWCSSR